MEEKRTILIVDDSRLIRKILSDTLCEDYEIMEAEDGLEAVDILQNGRHNISAVILDLVMPRLDGFGVLRHMSAENLLECLPVLLITSEIGEEAISAAYDMGVAEVVQKPFNRNIVKKRLRNILDLYDQKNSLWETVRRQTRSLELQARKLREANDLMIDALSTIIEYRSLESGQHTRRLRGFTKLLLNALPREQYPLTPEEIELISRASAMHDIGKIAIPDAVLLKPGKLTPDEFRVMQTHTLKGYEIVHRLHTIDNDLYLQYCREICRWHHERWDGRGYPDGLSGERIPISAQAVALADVFDALTHKRIYKDAYSVPETVRMILGGECGTFSPTLLECFERSLPLFEQLATVYHDDLPGLPRARERSAEQLAEQALEQAVERAGIK